MKPIIITKDSDGKIHMSEEELRHLLDETYANGYEGGYKDGRNWQTALPAFDGRPWWVNDHITITCETPKVTL